MHVMSHKPKRFVAVADTHGDMIDPQTEEAIYAFCADFKPTVRIHMGDAFDFRCLRRKATDEERAEGLEADWEAGERLLRRFFGGGTENYFLRGNHDERLWIQEQSLSGLAREYAQAGIKRIGTLLRKAKVRKMLPYDSRLGVLKLGNLKMVHGYAAGVGAAAKMARAYGNVIFGHVHTIEVAAVDSDDGPKEARCIGACCQLDMPYNAHKLGKLRHANGFAYGYLFDNGDYQLFQTRKIDGHFYAATDIKTY